MGYRFELHERPATKDLREVLARCLDLWSKVDRSGDTRVHVHLYTSHRAAIQVLAGLVPPESRGFSALHRHSENRTAAETLVSVGALPTNTWEGSFAGDIEPELLRPLLLGLSELAPDPLRRSALDVDVRQARWHGSSAGSTGAFRLSDFKVFQRKVRFHLTAVYEATDDRPKRDVLAELKTIADLTQLDFSRDQGVAVREAAAWTTERLATTAFGFDEVVERVSQSLLRDGFDWSKLPGVFRDGQGTRSRFAALAQGPKEDFRWESDVKALVAEALPAFRAKQGVFPDSKTYAAPFSGPWWIAVVFDTHPGLRIGRVFKLRCGLFAVENGSMPFKRSAPMLRCSGGGYHQNGDMCPEFAFNTHSELVAILDALRGFIPDFVERYRRHLAEVLLPALENFASVFPDPRRLTALGALERAREVLPNDFKAAELVSGSLRALPNSLAYREHRGAEVPADGVSSLLHYWSYHFVLGRTAIDVDMPFAGTPRISRLDMFWLELNPSHAPTPIAPPTIDSAVAASAMHRKRDQLRGRYSDMTAIVGLLEFKREGDRTVWSAQIEFAPNDREKHDWVLATHTLDAATGKPIATKFDERFSDRESRQRTFTEAG